jgi:hypothetical protein
MLVYDEAAHLIDAMSHFTGTGLEAGEAVVVIATQPHRDYLEARLRAHGVDLALCVRQYVPLVRRDAVADMIDGWPDQGRFVRGRGRIARGAIRTRLWGEVAPCTQRGRRTPHPIEEL